MFDDDFDFEMARFYSLFSVASTSTRQVVEIVCVHMCVCACVGPILGPFWVHFGVHFGSHFASDFKRKRRE